MFDAIGHPTPVSSVGYDRLSTAARPEPSTPAIPALPARAGPSCSSRLRLRFASAWAGAGAGQRVTTWAQAERPLRPGRAKPLAKKRILRTAIREVVVLHEPAHQRLAATIHWQGGVHTRLHVPKRATPVGSRTDPSLVDAVRSLATLPDAEIARILNMKKLATPRGLRWSRDRVRDFRAQHHIRLAPPPDPAEFLTGQQAAERLRISRHGIEALIRVGAIHNHHVTDFAPWRIPRADVESDTVRRLVDVLKRAGRLPEKRGCPEDQLLLSSTESVGREEGAS